MSQPVILYVENNLMLMQLVRDMLDLAGWNVQHLRNAPSARVLLRGEQPYDLLLVDNELQHMTGIELVRCAREFAHRKGLQILLFSIEDYEEEAKRAGANAFLRKPHDLYLMLDTVRRLLAAGAHEAGKEACESGR
ncbi:MAG TPA: response regulator [Pyrinomonadaceae bacterium]|nr:response regulator [Pyrinomonadaceae bacterium]